MPYVHQYILKGDYTNIQVKSYQTDNDSRTTPSSLLGYYYEYTILTVTVLPATGKIWGGYIKI